MARQLPILYFALLSLVLLSISASAGLDDAHHGLRSGRSHRARRSSVTEPSSARTASSHSVSKRGTGSGTKGVFAHMIVGNCYSYTASDWDRVVAASAAAGIDAIALNIGQDSFEPSQVALAYESAASASFKMFISFDMSIITSASTIVSYIEEYASHSGQYMVDSKPFVSTFSGETVTFGASTLQLGWEQYVVTPLAAKGITMFFVPVWTGLDASTAVSNNPVVDGISSWLAWPTTDAVVSDSIDVAFQTNALASSKTYMACVSPWFFTHYSYKNFIYNSDGSLFTTRWKQMMSDQLNPDFVELLTLNDFGESHYMIDPSTNDGFPTGTTWVSASDAMDHSSMLTLSKYFITWYKTGSEPTVTTDEIFYWYRPHSNSAVASSDSVGKPTDADWSSDNVYVVALLTTAGTVTVTSGSTSKSFSGVAGLNEFTLEGFSTGTQSFSLTRSGSTVLSGSGPVQIDNSISTYNFNYVAGMLSDTSSGSTSTNTTTTASASAAASSVAVASSTTSTSSSAAATSQTGLNLSLGLAVLAVDVKATTTSAAASTATSSIATVTVTITEDASCSTAAVKKRGAPARLGQH